jgi:hypothetical protein
MLCVEFRMSVMLSVTYKPFYAECHNAECHYAECHNVECHYAECHYAECHYAECRGAVCHCRSLKPHSISAGKAGA